MDKGAHELTRLSVHLNKVVVEFERCHILYGVDVTFPDISASKYDPIRYSLLTVHTRLLANRSPELDDSGGSISVIVVLIECNALVNPNL